MVELERPDARRRGFARAPGCVLLAGLVLASSSAPAWAAGEAASDEIGRPCDEHFFKPCPGALACVNNRCAPPRATAGEADAGTVTSTRTPEASRRRTRRPSDDREARALRLGVQSAFWLGVGGELDNPRPAYALAADFGFPTGRRARWHLELGYEDLNGYTGFRINPFVLGYSVPVYEGGVHLEVEVVAAIVQSEVLFDDGFAIALSSGLRAQLVAVYGVGFAAFAPLGFEVRYAYGLQDVGITTGVGVNWPMMLTVGLEL